jgi:hypothetical protein
MGKNKFGIKSASQVAKARAESAATADDIATRAKNNVDARNATAAAEETSNDEAATVNRQALVAETALSTASVAILPDGTIAHQENKPAPAAESNGAVAHPLWQTLSGMHHVAPATLLPNNEFVTPKWLIEKKIDGLPSSMPWVSAALLLKGDAAWAAMKLDESYSSADAAQKSANYLFRQAGQLSQRIFFCVSPGTKPFAVFKNVTVVQQFSFATRVTTILHPQIERLKKNQDMAQKLAPQASGLLRVQGRREDLEALPGAIVHPKATRDGLFTGEMPFEAENVKKADPTKVLMLPLDNIIHGANGARSLTVRFDWSKVKFGDVWQCAVALQAHGHCVSIRFGTLRVMAATDLTQEDVKHFEKSVNVKGVFTDVHRDRIPPRAAKTTPAAGEEEATSDPTGTDAPSTTKTGTAEQPVVIIHSLAPKTAMFWQELRNALVTKFLETPDAVHVNKVLRTATMWVQWELTNGLRGGRFDLRKCATFLEQQGLLLECGGAFVESV